MNGLSVSHDTALWSPSKTSYRTASFVLFLHRHEAATCGRDPDRQKAADLAGHSGRQDDPKDRRHPQPRRERGLKASSDTLRFPSCSTGFRHFPEHRVQAALHFAIYHLITNVQAVVLSKSSLKRWSVQISRLCSFDFRLSIHFGYTWSLFM